MTTRMRLATMSTAAIAALVLASACPAQSRTHALPSAPAPKPAAPVVVPPAGTPLDRVVAIVNGDLILDSDVDQERRFELLEPYRDEGKDIPRAHIIERLVNRDLIMQQARLQPEDTITEAQVTKELDQLRKNIPACRQFDCATKKGWDTFLASNGFNEATLETRWRERMEVLRFIEQRFRMGIRITPEEISKYYTDVMLPEYARHHATPPALDVLSDRIQEVLLEQRVSSLLGDWLKSLRAQGNVVVLHPGEEAP